VRTWLATNGTALVLVPLRIALIVVGAMVIRALTHRAISKITYSAVDGAVPWVLKPLKDRMPTLAAGLLSERRRQRAESIGSLLRSVVSATVFSVGALMILDLVGMNLAPVLTTAGIAGVALAFGAQSLVKDILSGIFMLMEDQYGVGDVVDVGEATGTVEAVGLRVTTLRDARGVLWYVRNGEIIRVGNKSQGWSVIEVDVPVPYGDIEDASEALQRATAAWQDDEDWAADFIDPPELLGVEKITAEGAILRVTAKTPPEAQWRVARELRRRVSDALDHAGIADRMAGGRIYVRQHNGGQDTDQAGPT